MSRRAQHTDPAPAPPPKRLATLEDAKAYMLAMRESLDPLKYSQCLSLFRLLAASQREEDQERMGVDVRDLLEDHPSLLAGFNIFLPEHQNHGLVTSANKLQQRDKQMEKEPNKEQVQEIDTNKSTEYCTSRINSLLQNYQTPVPSYHTDSETELLTENDSVSVRVPCSSDPNSKELLVNQSQERSSRGGSNILESVTDTMKHIESLLEKIQGNTITVDGHFQIEEHLTDLNLRCIQHVYDDYGLLVISELSENPRRILPVIKKRLIQTQAKLLKEAQHCQG